MFRLVGEKARSHENRWRANRERIAKYAMQIEPSLGASKHPKHKGNGHHLLSVEGSGSRALGQLDTWYYFCLNYYPITIFPPNKDTSYLAHAYYLSGHVLSALRKCLASFTCTLNEGKSHFFPGILHVSDSLRACIPYSTCYCQETA